MTVAWDALIGLLGLLFALGVVLLEVVRTQGEALLRVDAIEEAVRTQLVDRDDAWGEDGGEPPGVPVGTPVEPIELPAVDGRRVTLPDRGGSRVLLVHWNPRCGYCVQIAAALAELEPPLRRCGIELLLASYGGAAENRALAEEQGLQATILLQDETALDCFDGLGTPVAYLLDERGLVATPPARGADDVVALAHQLCSAATAVSRSG